MTKIERNKNRLKEILNIKTKGKLLDIGCGKGELLGLTKDYFDIQGIDISPIKIIPLIPKFTNKVCVGDIENMELQQDNYDVVTVFNVLEHLENPNQVVSKIHKSLKQEGFMIGSVPNNFGVIGKLATRMSNFDTTHISVYSPERWDKVFRNNGFCEISYFGEIMLYRIGKYLKTKHWRYLSFNLIFICEKNKR